MLPELGRYAATVLGAYAVTIVLLVLLVAASWRRASRMKRDLATIEAQTQRNSDGRA